jgi:hypothetical protein
MWKKYRLAMKTHLRMKCPNYSHWNRLEVEKVFQNPESPEPKVQILIPSYLPYKEEKCSKFGHLIAEEKELIRMMLGCWLKQDYQRSDIFDVVVTVPQL